MADTHDADGAALDNYTVYHAAHDREQPFGVPLQHTTFFENPVGSQPSFGQRTQTPDHSAPLLTEKDNSTAAFANVTPGASVPYDRGLRDRKKPFRRRWPWWISLLIGLLLLAIVALAVVLPIYFVIIRPHQHAQNVQANPGSPTGATTGANGSTIIASDGTTFTYLNEFGGYCESSATCLTLVLAQGGWQGWMMPQIPSTIAPGQILGRRH